LHIFHANIPVRVKNGVIIDFKLYPWSLWPGWIIALGRVISFGVPKGMKGTLDARCNDQNIDSISFSSPVGRAPGASRRRKSYCFL